MGPGCRTVRSLLHVQQDKQCAPLHYGDQERRARTAGACDLNALEPRQLMNWPGPTTRRARVSKLNGVQHKLACTESA